MLQSPSRAWLRCLVGILACGPTLMALGGCHHRSSGLNERVAYGQPNDEQIPRGFPGVDVSRTSRGGVSIRLLSARVGDGDPLYLIDGAPAVVDRGLGISWLRPEDIAGIRVLKDPAETAVYGPRGVNGVILVTTKLAEAMRRRKP